MDRKSNQTNVHQLCAKSQKSDQVKREKRFEINTLYSIFFPLIFNVVLAL